MRLSGENKRGNNNNDKVDLIVTTNFHKSLNCAMTHREPYERLVYHNTMEHEIETEWAISLVIIVDLFPSFIHITIILLPNAIGHNDRYKCIICID